MKKIAAILGALLVVLTVLTFVACENGVQKISGDVGGNVGINKNKAPSVPINASLARGYDAPYTPMKAGFILNWLSVGPDLDYVVYIKQEGKNSYYDVIDTPNHYSIEPNGYNWDGADPNMSLDVDKWSYFKADQFKVAGNFQFGVRSSYKNNVGFDTVDSDILWSQVFEIKKIGAPDASVDLGASGKFADAVVRFPKVEGATRYTIFPKINEMYVGGYDVSAEDWEGEEELSVILAALNGGNGPDPINWNPAAGKSLTMPVQAFTDNIQYTADSSETKVTLALTAAMF